MTRLEVAIADTLHEWAVQTAAQNGLSLDGYIEVLIALESGLTPAARDGRTLRSRGFIYREPDHYFVQDETARA